MTDNSQMWDIKAHEINLMYPHVMKPMYTTNDEMIFEDITNVVSSGTWGETFFKAISFTPARIFSVKNVSLHDDAIREFRAVLKKKVAVYIGHSDQRSLIVFCETDEDAVLLKLFFS
jgi:hypothetical protein